MLATVSKLGIGPFSRNVHINLFDPWLLSSPSSRDVMIYRKGNNSYNQPVFVLLSFIIFLSLIQ